MRDLHFRTPSDTEPIAVTLPVAASMLGCTVRAVRELIWAGKIKYAKLGKRFVVCPNELREYIQRQMTVAG
jgi:excisionase family DNA binding protein